MNSPRKILCIVFIFLFLTPILFTFDSFLNTLSTRDDANLTQKGVNPPWTRIHVYDDIGGTKIGDCIATDIENDGYPELVIRCADNAIFIVNYSNGNYNKLDLTVAEVSGKTILGIEVLDYDHDAIKEIYILTREDLGSSWRSEIWQGKELFYGNWSWQNVLTFEDQNLSLNHHYTCDYDGDGLRNADEYQMKCQEYNLTYPLALHM